MLETLYLTKMLTLSGITLASSNTARNLGDQDIFVVWMLNKYVGILSCLNTVSLKFETSCLRVMLKN